MAKYAPTRMRSGVYLNLNPRPGAGAQAALGVVAEYDLLSGCKLGGGESGGATVAMVYTPDASALIAISAVRLRVVLCCLALCSLAALHQVYSLLIPYLSHGMSLTSFSSCPDYWHLFGKPNRCQVWVSDGAQTPDGFLAPCHMKALRSCISRWWAVMGLWSM